MVLEELGIPQPPTIIFEDNMSTIVAARKGFPTARLKHVSLKQFHIQENIRDENIQLVHCPTQEMTADILTKHLVGSTFEKHRQDMMLPKEFMDIMDIEGCIEIKRMRDPKDGSINLIDSDNGSDNRYEEI